MIIIKKIKEQKLHNIIIIAASLNVIISPNSFMNFIPIKILAAIKFILTSIVILATILLTKPTLELIKKGNDKKEIRYYIIIYLIYIFISVVTVYDLYKNIKKIV